MEKNLLIKKYGYWDMNQETLIKFMEWHFKKTDEYKKIKFKAHEKPKIENWLLEESKKN